MVDLVLRDIGMITRSIGRLRFCARKLAGVSATAVPPDHQGSCQLAEATAHPLVIVPGYATALVQRISTPGSAWRVPPF
jgi:hypothetical protein